MAVLPTGIGPVTGGYQIERSLRFNSADSAYLNRTPASAGNRKTWTWSGWVKRGALGSAQVLMSSDVGTSNTTWIEFGFDAADTFTITAYATDLNTTSAVFRDPSAWYHVVVAFDSTQATAANRCKIYINGTQQTLTGAGFTLNADYGINNNQIHGIGYRNWASGVGRYFNGYMTEINFIDGQALTPSSFGQTNASTGVWEPKAYTGTYGTNGFYLKFDPNADFSADLLVVGGGGAGGGASNGAGGGGGAGGYRSFTSEPLVKGRKYTVTVGAGGTGGAGLGGSGGASVFNSYSAAGGGGGGKGGTGATAGASGGSGGGGGQAQIAGIGNTPSTSPSQGNNGGTPYGGGGGKGGNGSGGIGTSGGGAGTANSITGTSVFYAAGGSGGTTNTSTNSIGGKGDAPVDGNNSTEGAANTGSGGGGRWANGNANGKNGGSGVVIIKTPDSVTATFSGGVTQTSTTSGGFKIYTVTATSTSSETVLFS